MSAYLDNLLIDSDAQKAWQPLLGAIEAFPDEFELDISPIDNRSKTVFHRF